MSWAVFAIPVGLYLIWKYKPRVIWSTYPVSTAHLIAFFLHRVTALPWVADLRDPMTEVNPRTGQRAPADAGMWRIRRWIENLIVTHASRIVVCTPGALRLYIERYPQVSRSRWAIIENGYDEEIFAEVESLVPTFKEHKPIVLLHSGVLYYSADRDPTFLFAALGKLWKSKKLLPGSLRVVLRASGYEDIYRGLVRQHGVEELVAFEPAIPYREALSEMLSADGLLVFQGYTSNPAIPAKLYEYLRAGKPIFALVDSGGDTAALLKEAKVGTIVPLDSVDEIADGLLEFLKELQSGRARIPDIDYVQRCSRQSKAAALARILEEVDG
jgi:glycosyltransferase involved in cell wall biosynthesis